MEVTIKDLQDYLFERYKELRTEKDLFLKLVEEMGEIAEIINIRAGHKSSNIKNSDKELSIEIADLLHYAIAIAAINKVNLTKIILEKDKKASIKYNHKINLTDFIKNR